MDCNEVFDKADELFPLPPLSSLDCVSVPQFPLLSSPMKPKHGRHRKSPPCTSDDVAHGNPNELKKKKIIHRDVERQRRQEMSTLYTVLRSLLPPEYLKGKRSICDHMHETVKYIRQMQSRIWELSEKRDELKRLSDKGSATTVETLNGSKKDSVVVRRRSGGVQVVLHTAIRHRLPVSNVLEAVVAEGLEIVSFNSTKINDRLLHTIELDIGSAQRIDISELHHKLTNLEYFPLD
ncbi:transcription factor bHLH126-like [Momordica charantia]|uniref:Transcription factor bHLH126-like n=1 Tax=Momordica charantia TaxID=3673 RepID=A0A6J1DWE8_MOMCH|nr:transcription factor bHLH126-like [Momordica charantia]